MTELLIAIAGTLSLPLLLYAVFTLALAWIHYPHGILKAMRQKKKRKKEIEHEGHS